MAKRITFLYSFHLYLYVVVVLAYDLTHHIYVCLLAISTLVTILC